MKKLIFILASLILFTVPTFAQITFNWDAYPAPATIDGFKLFQSTIAGGPYSQVATITPSTATTYILARPNPGIYFWVLAAYKGTLQSAYSNEVTATVLPAPPTTLKITSQVASITRKSATLSAEATVPSDFTLKFGPSYGTMNPVVINLTTPTSASTSVTGLKNKTTYKYIWEAISGAQIATASGSFIAQ